MSDPHYPSKERTPLLAKIPCLDEVPTIIEATSSSSSTTLLEHPLPEVDDRQVGAVNFNFKLFVSLLWDSIPGITFDPHFLGLIYWSTTVILSYILQNSIQTTSIIIVGRLGPDELSVAAFSLMLAFVTGEYIIGFLTATRMIPRLAS